MNRSHSYRLRGPFCKLDKLPEELIFIDDFAKIGAFLLDVAVVRQQLHRLNDKLVVKAKEKPLLVKGSLIKQQKILRNTLEEELGSFGFTPKFGKALNILNPKVFRDVLRQGIILKDPGVELPHGEFNHAIQWLLVAYQQDESPFLNHSVIEVFKEISWL